jgi:hypothetical protein
MTHIGFVGMSSIVDLVSLVSRPASSILRLATLGRCPSKPARIIRFDPASCGPRKCWPKARQTTVDPHAATWPAGGRAVRQLLEVKRKTSARVELCGFDPDVWSGRAVQTLADAVLRQCIRSPIGACVLRAIMDISAHAILLADRPRRAVRVTRVRTRREDRSSIVVSSSRRTRRRSVGSGGAKAHCNGPGHNGASADGD